MSNNRFHFQIPKENIRAEKIVKTGFGPSTYQRQDYRRHGEELLDQYNNFYKLESSKADFETSSQLFFSVEVPSGREIKSEKIRLQNLGIELISYSTKNTTKGVAYIRKSRYDKLIDKIRTYAESDKHTGRSNISIIERINPIDHQSKVEDIDIEKKGMVSVVFSVFSTLPAVEKRKIIDNLIKSLNGRATEFTSRVFSNGLCMVSCKVRPMDIIKTVRKYSTVEEVRYNSASVIPTALPKLHELPKHIFVEKPISNSSVCIIDSCINRHIPIFKGLISKIEKHVPAVAPYPAYDHGTFVASRCLFGDSLEDCLHTGILQPYCRVMNVQVFGNGHDGKPIGHQIIDLMGILEDVVLDNYKNIRVYNLSLGVDSCIKDGTFSRFAKLLDYLSKNYKVLFVVACGNISKLQGAYPAIHFNGALSRISSPAESLLSISVGSIAKYIDPKALALYHEISPFSRIGPGADGGIKPEVVAHGGNLLAPYVKSPRLGVYGISSDGSGLCVDHGTSYSAPLISQYAQRLFDIYPSSNPNLIKALLFHFSEPREVPKTMLGNPRQYVGFGEPIIDLATEAGDHNGAFVYEGKLDQKDYQFIKFHIPSSLTEVNRDSKLEISITITYDPSVNVNNDLEYSQSRITASLFKPTSAGIKEISISDETTYSVPWNPTIQFRKSFTRSYMTGGWELRLRLYTRGDLSEKYTQDYAVTIEIRDLKGKQDIYSDISHEYGSIYKKIKLRIAA